MSSREALRAPFVLAVGLVLALSLLPSAPARAADGLRVEGRGFGHGIGMSQYGAQRAATKGVGWQRILRTYYPGTRLGRVGGEVAVWISGDDGVMQVRQRPRLSLRSLARGRSWTLARVDAQAVQWRVRADARGRSVVQARHRSGGWRTRLTFPGAAEVSAGGAPVTLVTRDGSTAYRGRLRSAPANDSGTRRDTVNRVSLEGYLRGVVPQEVPALWEPDAVRAQAVAARTYAAWERAEPLARHYQICDTDRCQVYGGASAEHPATDAAIRATARRVLTKGGEPAFTQFSASNGGYSVRGAFDYLPARKDPWDRWSGNPWDGWVRTFTAAELERAFDGIGDVESVNVVRRDGRGSYGGRAVEVVVNGSERSLLLSGDLFRIRLGLPSTLFRTTAS